MPDVEKPVVLTVSLAEKRQCLKRCYTATGGDCNCICGGRNHGIDTERKEPLQQPMFAGDGSIVRFNNATSFFREEKHQNHTEINFGSWWRDGRRFPTYRVAWIAGTGELYAVDRMNERVEIMGLIMTEKEVREFMDGWEDVCGLMNSLQWVRDKIA